MNALKRLPKQAQQQVTLGKAPGKGDVPPSPTANKLPCSNAAAMSPRAPE